MCDHTALHLAELQRKADAFDKLRAVITAKHWRPAERVTLAAMVIATTECNGDAWRRLEAKSAAQLAEMVGKGVSKQTANDIIQRFTDEQVGLLKRKQIKTAYNRYNHPIPIEAANPDRDDYVITDVTFDVKATIPAELPPLPESEYHEKARSKAARVRSLANAMKETPCPHCGTVGEWHAHCDSCGKSWTADELAEAADELAEAEQAAKQAPSEVQTMRPSEPPEQEAPESSEVQTAPPSEPPTHESSIIEAVRPANAEPLRKSPATKRRAVRNTTLPPSVSYAGFDEPEFSIEVKQEPSEVQTPVEASEKSSVISLTGQILDEEGSTEVVLPVVPDANDALTGTLTGADSVQYLADIGAKFSFAQARSKIGINPRDDDGREVCFLDAPSDADAAKRHLARGGNVGLLPEHSDTLAVVDVDAEISAFLARWPVLALQARVFRGNAPERAKPIVLCPDVGDSRTFTSADGSRRIELIGKRKQAIVAGTHETGATIKLLPAYEFVVLTWAQLTQIAVEWTGDADNTLSASTPPPARASADRVRTSGDQLRDAIQWWIADPRNQSEVDTLLATCHTRGQYVSVRADDGTPSTRRTDTRDGYSKRTWRDYGSGETLDDYELYCRLNGVDKRVHKWQVVNDWRAERGMRPLQLEGAR